MGTGFTASTLADLMRRLEPLRRDASPFEGRQPPKGTVFVEPGLVARVEFREWTRAGTLRAPSFKGLREDIDPERRGPRGLTPDASSLAWLLKTGRAG